MQGDASEKKTEGPEVYSEWLTNEHEEEEEKDETVKNDPVICFPEEIEFDMHVHLPREGELDIPNFQNCLTSSFKDRAECTGKENVDDCEIPIRLSHRLSSLFE